MMRVVVCGSGGMSSDLGIWGRILKYSGLQRIARGGFTWFCDFWEVVEIF